MWPPANPGPSSPAPPPASAPPTPSPPPSAPHAGSAPPMPPARPPPRPPPRLYLIHLDPAYPPPAPRDILWSVPIGGSSGNSPAAAASLVFIATVTDESGLSPGRILAYPAGAPSAPEPLWTFTNTEPL